MFFSLSPSSLPDTSIASNIIAAPKIAKGVGVSLKINIPKMVAPIGSPRIVIAIKFGEKIFKAQL